jgi:hypothetical protein
LCEKDQNESHSELARNPDRPKLNKEANPFSFEILKVTWIPAFAGMTSIKIYSIILRLLSIVHTLKGLFTT